jgi:hypothetical protein
VTRIIIKLKVSKVATSRNTVVWSNVRGNGVVCFTIISLPSLVRVILSSMKNEITVVFFGFQVRFGKT